MEDKIVTIEVTERVKQRLSKLKQRHKVTYSVALDQLLNFWEMRYFDILIERVKFKYDKGLNAKELTQLSILYTLLQYIDDRIGLAKRAR